MLRVMRVLFVGCSVIALAGGLSGCGETKSEVKMKDDKMKDGKMKMEGKMEGKTDSKMEGKMDGKMEEKK